MERRREKLLSSARRDAATIMLALRPRGVPDVLLARAYLGGLGESAPTVDKVVDAKKAVRARRARQNRKASGESVTGMTAQSVRESEREPPQIELRTPHRSDGDRRQ